MVLEIDLETNLGTITFQKIPPAKFKEKINKLVSNTPVELKWHEKILFIQHIKAVKNGSEVTQESPIWDIVDFVEENEIRCKTYVHSFITSEKTKEVSDMLSEFDKRFKEEIMGE
jgi:hypothetical protein